MVQQYLPDVRAGDKRIILINGEAKGAINRVPQEGEARSNLHVGGSAQAVELTNRDREICAIIGPELKNRGLVFVGIDVIGDYLTEINVTSPTGIREIERFTGQSMAALFWERWKIGQKGNGQIRCRVASQYLQKTWKTGDRIVFPEIIRPAIYARSNNQMATPPSW